MTVDRRPAYAALAWAVVFGLAHVYWYLGGSIARPSLPPATVDLFGAVVLAVFVVGANRHLLCRRG